eukprot:11207787-Ditylum_brightwellii.AAC.1
MGIKSLNGAIHHFLLQNQEFPPVLTAGECKIDTKKQSMGAISVTAKYVYMVLSPLDLKIISSFEDERFISHLCATYIRWMPYICHNFCGYYGQPWDPNFGPG